jgi:hypothetical protein
VEYIYRELIIFASWEISWIYVHGEIFGYTTIIMYSIDSSEKAHLIFFHFQTLRDQKSRPRAFFVIFHTLGVQ